MSSEKPYKTYAVPGLLGLLIFASDFLNTNLFGFSEKNFAVWFVLSLLCFASGWFIDKTLGWNRGGKIVFAVIVSVTAVSIAMITFFAGYFSAAEILTENLVLYSLRNIMLGAMAFFGMSIQQVISTRRDTELLTRKVELYEKESEVAKKEAELIIKEASIKAEKIVNDAEAKAKNIVLQKERIEKELKEFIDTEKELLKRYEEK